MVNNIKKKKIPEEFHIFVIFLGGMQNIENWKFSCSSITPKILVCAMESCYKNVSKIHNVTLIFEKGKEKLIWNIKNQ